MERNEYNLAPFADVVVKLLQGPLYDESKNLWNEMLIHQKQINLYLEQMGLELIVEKNDGYAFLRQIELDESGRTIGLIRRQTLTFEQTLLCVLLREWIDEFETDITDNPSLFISHKDFRDRIEVFFKDQSNKVKLLKELDRYIRDMVKLGFLKPTTTENEDEDIQLYEVRRILKSRITSDKLEEFKNKLQQYAQ
ncbi:MAG: DUF4194 domain-containing protein [Bacteroidales bacterium]